MKKTLVIAALLVSSAAWGQTKLVPPDHRADANCKPIGRTATGELVYSMKCETLPAPPPRAASVAAPATAGVAGAAAADSAPVEVEEEDKGGLFGHAPSFIRPTTNDVQRPAGVGPASQTR